MKNDRVTEKVTLSKFEVRQGKKRDILFDFYLILAL